MSRNLLTVLNLGGDALHASVLAWLLEPGGEHGLETALLEAGRAHLPHLRQVICCPPALEAHLRPGLARLGLAITDEAIAFKRHRSYDVIASAPGEVTEPPHPWGPRLIARRDPHLARHLAIQRQLMRRDFATELRSHRQPDGSLGPMGRKLSMLEALLTEAQGWTKA